MPPNRPATSHRATSSSATGVAAGRIDQGGPDAQRAVGHLLGQHLAHRVELRFGGGSVLVADTEDADRLGSDQRGDVLGATGALDDVEVLREPGPGHLDAVRRSFLLQRGAAGRCTGPIDSPSPKIWVVTPWTSSPSDVPSSRTER